MVLQRVSQRLGLKPALIVVDMSRGFTDPASPLGAKSDAVVEANCQLLQLFRGCHWPVFFTTVVYDHESQGRVFRDRLPALNILTRGSHWIDIDPRLAPQAGELIVDKHWASGFFASELAHLVRESAADCLVVTGLTTSGCVRATALDGMQHGYRVFIPREACGDRSNQAHEANLHDLHAKYADVLPLDHLLERLHEQCGNDHVE